MPAQSPSERLLSRWQGTSLMLFLACLFAANHIAARLAFGDGATPLVAVISRATATALVVALYLRYSNISCNIDPIYRKDIILGGVLMSVQGYCLYSAVARIPVGIALLIFDMFPLIFTLLAWFYRLEAPSWRTLFTLLTALLGLSIALGILDSASSAQTESWMSGILYALGSSFAFALVLLRNETKLKNMDTRVRTVRYMLIVSLLSIVAGFFQPQLLGYPSSAKGWISLVALCVLYGTAITGLFMTLPRLGQASSSGLLNFEPIAALLMAWMVLDQPMTASQMGGALIVVGAVLYLGRR